MQRAVETYEDRTFIQIRRGLRVEKYSYRDFWEASLKFHTFLKDKDLEKGDRVLIWAPNMPEWDIVLAGCLIAGIVLVPISTHASIETVNEYIDQTEAKFLFKSVFMREDMSDRIDVIELESLPGTIAGLKKTQPADVGPADLAEIMYTSGTTGDPSGVMLSHENILIGIEGLKRLIPPSKEYRLLSILPLSHALEQFVGFFTVLGLGATVYYVPKVSPVVIARSLNKYKITHLVVVPQLLKMLWDAIEYRVETEGKSGSFSKALSLAPRLPFALRRLVFRQIHSNLGGQLKMFGCAGAPLDKDIAENWEKVGIVVIEGYGMTETSAAITANSIDDRQLGSVGKILPGIDVKFSKEGELLTKGPNVTKGYFKNLKKTEESFTEDGYLKTGDVGYVADDGFVYLSGRKKFKIVTSSGEKVYPEDIERKLNEHPAVKESCVVGVDKGAGEIVYAAVVLRKKTPIEDVIAEVNENLESHQVVLEYGVWPEDDFPRTRTLKKDRKSVLSWAEGQMGMKAGDALTGSAEGGPKVDKLAGIISAICDVEVDDVDDDMLLVFDLDLDSLKRVALVSFIEEEFGVAVEEEDITDKTTVRQLRDLVKKGEKVTIERTHVLWPLNPVVVVLREVVRRLVIFPLFRLIAPPVEIEGGKNLENMDGPGIIVFNHVGHNEPGMIGRALSPSIRKKLTSIADPRSFRTPFRAFLMYFIGSAFPVEKFGGPVRHTLEMVADLLEKDWLVLISPEGQRSSDGKLKEFHRGAAVLAVETGVPVYPIKVKNYRELYPVQGKDFDFPTGKGRVTLVFGKPLRFERAESYDSANERLRSTIEKM